MPSPRIRMSRYRTDERPVSARIPASCLADLYREEFLKHQRCLQQQREYDSERVILDVEAALRRILEPRSPLRPAERRTDGEPLVAQDRRAHRPLGLVESQEIPLTVSLTTLRADLLHIVAAAIGAADAGARGAGACPRHAGRHGGTDRPAGGGKAAVPMARAFVAALPASLRRGVLVNPAGGESLPPPFTHVAAGIPCPTSAVSERAARPWSCARRRAGRLHGRAALRRRARR